MGLTPIGWLLIALIAVFVLTSIALLFIGVMKKNKTALIASAITFSVLIVGVLIFLSLTMVTSVKVSQSPEVIQYGIQTSIK